MSVHGDLSRRSFIASGAVASGVIAAGTVGVARAGEVGSQDADANPFVNARPAIGHLVHDTGLCAGCRVCEITCSINKWGVMNSDLACIHIHTDVLGGWISHADTCRQCLGPECFAACPTGALHIDEVTGARAIDRDVCIGCQSCLNACPATPSNIRYNAEQGVCVKCDLCGGDPPCVKNCPAHALSVSWDNGSDDPNHIVTASGIAVDVVLSGAIVVIARDSISLSDIDAQVTDDGVRVQGAVASTYTQPFTAKIKASFFDAEGNVLYFSDRIEEEVAANDGAITFSDAFETDSPEAVTRVRLEIMCGKIAG